MTDHQYPICRKLMEKWAEPIEAIGTPCDEDDEDIEAVLHNPDGPEAVAHINELAEAAQELVNIGWFVGAQVAAAEKLKLALARLRGEVK